MSAAPNLMYSHRQFLGTRPPCPRLSRCSVDNAPKPSSDANLKLFLPPNKGEKKRNAMLKMIQCFPPECSDCEVE